MAYSNAKLKSSGVRASPCFRPFWIGKLSDKCLPIQTLPYVSFKHNLINLTGFIYFFNLAIAISTSRLLDQIQMLQPYVLLSA
jgi:hypothetical protein